MYVCSIHVSVACVRPPVLQGKIEVPGSRFLKGKVSRRSSSDARTRACTTTTTLVDGNGEVQGSRFLRQGFARVSYEVVGLERCVHACMPARRITSSTTTSTIFCGSMVQTRTPICPPAHAPATRITGKGTCPHAANVHVHVRPRACVGMRGEPCSTFFCLRSRPRALCASVVSTCSHSFASLQLSHASVRRHECHLHRG